MNEEVALSTVLNELDETLAHREDYFRLRQAKADSVFRLIEDTKTDKDKLPLLLEYCHLWHGLSADSVINISNEGIRIGIQEVDSFYTQQFFITRAHGFFNRGQVHDCIEDLNHVSKCGVLPGVEERYHYMKYLAYVTLGAFYSESDQWTDYMGRGRAHLEALKSELPPSSPQYIYYDGIVNMVEGKQKLMEMNFQKVVAETDPHDPINSLAHTFLGHLYYGTGDIDRATLHFATAARLNLEDANLHEIALLLLGELLFKQGENHRAGSYLSVALETAIRGNMKFNLMRVNSALLDVSKALNAERRQKQLALTVSVIILTILLAALAFMIYIKRREVKQLRHTENKLARANLAKETYIKEFMNLCASYTESLEDYNTMSKRKITAGQTEELLAFMKSGKVIEEQRHKFFDVFDSSFLGLFPTYVDDVNLLLQPDKQISTPPGTLTTELRILALSRLGIDDVQAVARFLGISANTIYTYRNKLRTRAIDRNTFEEDAKHIGTV